MKEFVLDTKRGLVHRRSRAQDVCGVDLLMNVAERDSETDTLRIMQTQGFDPCDHCYR